MYSVTFLINCHYLLIILLITICICNSVLARRGKRVFHQNMSNRAYSASDGVPLPAFGNIYAASPPGGKGRLGNVATKSRSNNE
ncbi:TPA: hypothetical protein MIY20_09910 [Klebsiella pneumoniae]|nr:hypothetical protein AM486_06885 [Klebsiella pneumoniae]HBX3683557.1 hypothetical protein [Klebsiella pneumoniae subsp. pneumoniae]EIW8534097.1 hypothetical protein [Klebsiella pneumoniae]EIW9089589.1 hypothetical protein [Klebsiella pneumoniae]EIW9100456.1 hypothetical protein [Klebsiella pneumoniae]